MHITLFIKGFLCTLNYLDSTLGYIQYVQSVLRKRIETTFRINKHVSKKDTYGN